MRTKAASILLLGVLLLTVASVSGQDVAFSQFYANPVYLNPALAGNRICPRITLNYRNQYPSLAGNYVTYNASFDMYSRALTGGVAVLVTNDMTGPLASFSGSAIYSYHLNLSQKLTLNAAMQAGYYQYRLNWDKLVFEDMIVPGTGEVIPGSSSEAQPPELSVGDVDFSTGMVLGYEERFYFGAAVHHITSPDLAFYEGNISRLDPKLTLHAGALFNLKEALPGRENDNLSL
jgi:type IX secretion system PorP/SprF family membrane protein